MGGVPSMPSGQTVALAGPAAQSLEQAGLRPGQTFQTRAQGQGPNLFVRVAGLRLGLPQSAGFQTGQPLALEIVQTQSGLQVRAAFAHAQQDATPAVSTAQAALGQTLANVLPALGSFATQAQAARLLPAAMPLTERAVTLLLSLFAGKQPLGNELAQLQQIVAGAVEARAVPESVLTNLAAAVRTLQLEPGASIREMVQALLKQTSDPSPETRLAHALRAGGLIEEDAAALMRTLRGQLAELRDHGGLQRFAARQGLGEALRSLTGGLIDRLQGGALQNLRGLEQPYQFAELFFSPDSPFQRAQLHIFGEGGGKNWRHARDRAAVVLDLDSRALGPLWINLSIRARRCQCTIRASNGPAVQALRNEAGGLREALAGAGYPGALLRVQPWDGNRLGETLALMQRFTGIQEKA